MKDAIEQAIDAARQGDVEALKPLLHPYLHWSEGELRLRGRVNVLSHLAGPIELARPDAVELRDGQIYRWKSVSASSV